MAAVTIIGTVSALFVEKTRIRSQLAGAGGLANGQLTYTDGTTGTALPTDGTNATKAVFRGVVVNAPAGAGYPVDVVEEGYVAGFDVSGLAFGALLYVSDTPGVLSTTAGTNSSVVGRVAALTDKDSVAGKPSKVVYVRPSVI